VRSNFMVNSFCLAIRPEENPQTLVKHEDARIAGRCPAD
jgi:hypothetical protein